MKIQVIFFLEDESVEEETEEKEPEMNIELKQTESETVSQKEEEAKLAESKEIIDEKTILIFDEFIINESWEQDEYKALNDFCVEFDLSYEVLGVSFMTKQVAVKIM